MADEMTPWYTASWNLFIPQRLSYTIDFEGAFAHPKVCATLSSGQVTHASTLWQHAAVLLSGPQHSKRNHCCTWSFQSFMQYQDVTVRTPGPPSCVFSCTLSH